MVPTLARRYHRSMDDYLTSRIAAREHLRKAIADAERGVTAGGDPCLTTPADIGGMRQQLIDMDVEIAREPDAQKAPTDKNAPAT